MQYVRKTLHFNTVSILCCPTRFLRAQKKCNKMFANIYFYTSFKLLTTYLLNGQLVDITVMRLLQATDEITYSSAHNVCLALLSSKMPVKVVEKGWNSGKNSEREEQKTKQNKTQTDCITE